VIWCIPSVTTDQQGPVPTSLTQSQTWTACQPERPPRADVRAGCWGELRRAYGRAAGPRRNASTKLASQQRTIMHLKMAMVKTRCCPNPYPRRKNTLVKKPIPITGIKFCPNPYPCGFRIPNEFSIPTNINIKNNSSYK
jgi:hypothetical protein